MSTAQSFVITDDVLFEAAGLFAEASYDALLKMVTASAKVTHPCGNRRYKDYVFNVYGNEVRGVSRFQTGIAKHKESCAICGDVGKLIVYDECPHCYGEKCAKCNQEGTIRKEVRCTCQSRKK